MKFFSKQSSPFLRALEQIQSGELLLTTPDGAECHFKGATDFPRANWHIHDWNVFDDIVARGELGFADSYIDGRWDSSDLVALIHFGLANDACLERFFYGHIFYALWLKFKNYIFSNTPNRSKRNVMAHYDLGNDFYSLWLDKSMTYSCGLFAGDTKRTLEEAQTAKYERILHKLQAKPGEHILEIGCGWGGFAEMAAKKGLRVTAITLAGTQANYAKERIKKQHLDHLVSIELVDYRAIEGQFDHIVSIGMFEHVGESYWPIYFETVKKNLKPSGKALIQSIALDDAIFDRLGDKRGFVEEYIFPGGMLPSKARFRKHAQEAGLYCQEVYAFGKDYALTLRHWLGRFDDNIQPVRALGYDERFIRLWRLYLTSCIASFESGRCDVMQVELTHGDTRIISAPAEAVIWPERQVAA